MIAPIITRHDFWITVRPAQHKNVGNGVSIVAVFVSNDIVGIYYEPSTNHEKAFKNAGNDYFVDGDPKQPGTVLKGGRGFSFNTHVGIVGAFKNGTPIVFHNVHGTIYSEPANKLSITWVKRT